MVAKLAKESKMRGRQSLSSGLRKRVTAYTDQSSIHGNEHYIRVNIIARMEYLPFFSKVTFDNHKKIVSDFITTEWFSFRAGNVSL